MYASGLHGLARNLDIDLKPLRVNVVCPRSTDTELWGPHSDMRREMVAKKALLGKAGLADKVAEAYLYLMRNTNATGAVVSSSGGSTLQ